LSDKAYKKNFKEIDDPLSILDKIKAYEFDWIDNDETSYGIIAQDLEQVLPELVKTNKAGQKTVHYIPLIAILIEAIKQLKK
jgi:hypothetical protein